MNAATEFPRPLRALRTELWTLFEYSPLGLAQCQRSGNITALSPALEKMLGGPLRIAPSLSFLDLVPPPKRIEAQRLLRELFEQHLASFQIDSEVIGAKGESLRWTAWLVTGTNGNPDYVLTLAAEAPHERAADQRLQQVEKLETLGRLAGGVAHDFNNLLTGVLLYCDLLMSTPDLGERALKYAEEIRNAGIQATGLVRQLLTVARPKNSEPRLFSLNEVVEGMRNLLGRLIGDNIDLQFHLDANLGLVKMDPTQAQQILLNLVLNARDALPGGGQITVETSNCEIQVLTPSDFGANAPSAIPCALFTVADNGIGMDAVTQAHLFEAFFTTKAGTGTGLGLATVHDIVTSSGGLIHVESAPTRGARLSILLPLVPAAVLDSHKLPDFCSEKSQKALITAE
jgi:two-component system, cell cycle sensor histidine kinase and response regulator CckA